MKKRVIYVIAIFAFIMLVGGVSYAYFVYDKDVADVALEAGEMSISFVNNSNTLTATSVSPQEDAVGKISPYYIDFTVTGITDTEAIYYEINVVPASGNTIDGRYIKVYLTDQSNVEVVSPKIYSTLGEASNGNGKVIYSSILDASTTGNSVTVTQDYRLRVWIDESYGNLTAQNFNFSIYLYAKNSGNSFYQTIKNSSATYIKSYDDVITSNPTFTTQDTVGTNANKKTVYYYTGSDALANANVLFAGYCWQIIRTTDTGGVRLIYNGIAVDNKCETTRDYSSTKGINHSSYSTTTTISGTKAFGRSYDYDLDAGTFTIQETTGLPTTWSDSTYSELIGTYYCSDGSTTCSTLYYIGGYQSATQAVTESYTIGIIGHYSQMGTSAYNPEYRSPATVGYMFNKVYTYKTGADSRVYANDVTWDDTNNIYILDATTSTTLSAPDDTHHYACDTDCTKVRYYYYYYNSTTYYYVLLENGDDVNGALNKMLNYKANNTYSDVNINVYNSAIKGYLDNWYAKNLSDYTTYLDTTAVYCNDRSITSLTSWDKDTALLTSGYSIRFKQYSTNRDLNCVNEYDRFSVSNSNARLSYPIGLLTEPERGLMADAYAKTGVWYWGASPSGFGNFNASVHYVSATGGAGSSNVVNAGAARGVISLRPDTEITSGDGSYTSPYIVGPLVTRTSSWVVGGELGDDELGDGDF